MGNQKEHRAISQACLLDFQSWPAVQRHYHHKTPLCYVTVWEEIAITWKLERFFNIDFC